MLPLHAKDACGMPQIAGATAVLGVVRKMGCVWSKQAQKARQEMQKC